MGIFIFTAVSKSVTEKEWDKVYKETLTLMEALPFAERGTITCEGKEIVCAVRTKEREVAFGESKERGWCTTMDYNSLDGAEEYFIPEKLVDDRMLNPSAGDAMLEALPAYMNYDSEDERFCQTYSILGGKTQGCAYHMYLLSVACLIEDRLGEKAFVYGDITYGQCRKAVKMANEYLEKPIEIPARCEAERLYRRIRKLSFDEIEQMELFEQFYLGIRDECFYKFEREHFQKNTTRNYWKRKFEHSYIGTTSFQKNLKKYLSSGLGLAELCSVVNMRDKDGNYQYERFVQSVMDTKIHIKEKDTEDYLEIRQNSEQPYGTGTLMAEFLFDSAHNPSVERCIPIEEIRTELKNGIGTEYDVDHYIDRYLEEEEAAPEIDISKWDDGEDESLELTDADMVKIFAQMIKQEKDDLQKQKEQYEIVEYEDLLEYKNGCSVEPGLQDVLRKSILFYQETIREERYHILMSGTHEERCRYLIEQNRHLLLRDREWMTIFSEIEKYPETYERYYPMVRVQISSIRLMHMVRAFVVNDELYEYAKEMVNVAELDTELNKGYADMKAEKTKPAKQAFADIRRDCRIRKRNGSDCEGI